MPGTGDPGALTLVTGNAASGRDRRGRPDAPLWATSAAALAPDVVALQEVDHLLPRSGGVDQTAQVAAGLGFGTARFAAAVHGTPGHRESFRAAAGTLAEEPSYGVALLSRHPVRRWWEHRMGPSSLSLPLPGGTSSSPRVAWVPDEPRVALAGLVAHPGGDVTVVCTHLSFSPLRATAQLREIVAWAHDLPRPLVLLGDLNLPGRLPARVTGWRGAVAAPTYPSARPTAQLDHVLLDDPDGVWAGVEGRTAVVAESDHLAVVVALSR